MAPRKKVPAENTVIQEVPPQNIEVKDIPPAGKPINTVIINGHIREIKPTRLRYQRDNTAAFYRVFDQLSLVDILSMQAGTFGDERDGDKCVCDWLTAVFDDYEFVKANYDYMNTEDVENILKIFKRVNKIDEKEERAKNAVKNLPPEAKA